MVFGSNIWTVDINMASGGRTDHEGLSRSSNPENELLSFSDILLSGDRVAGQCFKGQSLC